MTCHVELSQREYDLVVDLLLKEQRGLRMETHRADRFEARRILEERLHAVDQLLDRLQGVKTPMA